MEWELKERSKSCFKCGEKFIGKESYQSAMFIQDKKLIKHFPKEKVSSAKPQALSHLKNSGYRVELCQKCWGEIFKDSPEFHWTGEFLNAKVEEENSPKFDKKKIIDVFREQYDLSKSATDPDEKMDKNALVFFLAIMLERKRIVKQQKDLMDSSSGAKMAVYELIKTNEIFEIFYPLLTEENVQNYQQSIQELIES